MAGYGIDDPELEGWDNEREAIIDDTLEELRDQSDDKQELSQHGGFAFNPQTFGSRTYMTMGPVMFEQAYSTKPDVNFGQVAFSLDSSQVSTGTTTDVPMVVAPIVSSWIVTNGEYAGFYLGVLALSAVPAGIQQHEVSWIAIGNASSYVDLQQSEAWTEAYDYNEADYLTEVATEDDQF